MFRQCTEDGNMRSLLYHDRVLGKLQRNKDAAFMSFFTFIFLHSDVMMGCFLRLTLYSATQ
jgi:hypothetical protein